MESKEKYIKAIDAVMEEYESKSGDPMAKVATVGQFMGIKRVLDTEYSLATEEQHKSVLEVAKEYFETKWNEIKTQ